jgi:membrane protein
LDEQIQGLVGREGADMIQELIQNTGRPADNLIASIVGLVTLLLGAGGVFGQLQEALNTVWGVQPKPGRGILGTIKDRFLSFTMVLGVGFLLLVSLIVSAFVTAVGAYVQRLFPGTDFVLQAINFLISFGVVTLLFALIFKILPDAKIQWQDVWIGAAFTSLLFSIGKTLIGLYLGNSGVLSTYGAAGSLIVILLWVFYSAQILLFGAEFTQVYAQRYGSHIRPDANAVAVTPAVRVEEGLPPVKKAAQLSAEAEPPLPFTPVEPPPPPKEESRPLNTAFALVAAFFGALFGFVMGIRRDDETA